MSIHEDNQWFFAENLRRKYQDLCKRNSENETAISQRVGTILAGSLTASGFLVNGVWAFVQTPKEFAASEVKVIVGILTICGLVSLGLAFNQAILILSNRFGQEHIPRGIVRSDSIADESTYSDDPILNVSEGLTIMIQFHEENSAALPGLSREAALTLYEAKEARDLYLESSASLERARAAANAAMNEMFATLIFFTAAVIVGLGGSFFTQAL